jgi:hypothetical protein
MSDHPETGSYQSRFGDEQFIRFHSKSTVQILFIEPFFEERNFLRRTLIELARTLARKGIGSFIPDLPGTGESPVALNDVTFADWRDAVADASRWMGEMSGKAPHIAALRGGALIDDVAVGASRWRFAPVTGADLLRPMRRAASLIGEEGSLASYPISSQMLAGIEQATPRAVAGPLRECQIQSGGAPLWRRAEPGEDLHLVAALADDIAHWIETCAPR